MMAVQLLTRLKNNMVIRACDKCKKVIKNDKGRWIPGEYYDYHSKAKRKLNKQVLRVSAAITLECGNDFDLCNDCASDLIELKGVFKIK